MSFIDSSRAGRQQPRFTKQTTERQIVVEVGERVKKPRVVRDGLAIGVHQIDPTIFEDFFGGRRPLRQVVVGQSIPAGTPVREGTSVDLVLAAPGRIPLRIVRGVHTGISTEMTIDAAYNRLVAQREPELRRIVARTEERGALAIEDENRLGEIFGEADFPLSDQPGSDVEAAYTTVQTLLTFGGG